MKNNDEYYDKINNSRYGPGNKLIQHLERSRLKLSIIYRHVQIILPEIKQTKKYSVKTDTEMTEISFSSLAPSQIVTD